MYCPLLKEDCKKEKCAWYVKIIEECAVLSIPGTIMSLNMPPDEDECPNCGGELSDERPEPWDEPSNN